MAGYWVVTGDYWVIPVFSNNGTVLWDEWEDTKGEGSSSVAGLATVLKVNYPIQTRFH